MENSFFIPEDWYEIAEECFCILDTIVNLAT